MKKQGLGVGAWKSGIKSPRLGIRGWGAGSLALLGILVILSTAGYAAEPTPESAGMEMRITVRVQDYAQVPRATLAGAKQEATRILNEAGIGMAWFDCGGAAENSTADPECAKPFAPTDLLLRILPRSMAERVLLTDSTFGFALQSTDDRLGFAASVFEHRVRELSEELGDSPATILGLVMAHEIGHLLLKTTAHSPTGIMRARLNREDLLRPLCFTLEQQNLLRDDVRERIRLQEARQAAEAATPR